MPSHPSVHPSTGCAARIRFNLPPKACSKRFVMSKHETATIREAFRQQGLDGAELEAAVLAYLIANNLPLENGAETITEMKRFIAAYVHDTLGAQA
jgi:hypothetical protein